MVARDRGQLLLLGGLAIAIVFLTAIPLSNSLVVSESASSSETVGDIDSAAQREAGVERGLRTFLNSTDNRRPAALNRSVRNFTRYYTRVSTQQDGVYVNVTLNVTATEGKYFEQSTRGDFTRPDPGGPGGDNNWDLSENTDEIAIFNMTLEQQTATDLLIEVTGDSGVTNEVRVAADPSASTLIIDRTYGSNPTETECSGGTVELDLVQGECDGDTTESFDPITSGLDAPYTVRFERGNSVRGEYTYAADGEFPDSSYGSPDPAYSTYGIQPAFDVRYIGPDLSYNETILVDGTT